MLDRNTLMSNEQSLALVAATPTLSDNSIDLGDRSTVDDLGNPLNSDPGRGSEVELECQVVETFTSGGAATVTVEVVMADNAALSTNLTVIKQTPAIAKASLVAGSKFRISADLPPGISQRYLGLRYTVGTADGTAGKVTAGIVLDRTTVFA